MHVPIHDGAQGVQHFQLLIAHGIRRAARRRLHRENAKKLQQMTLHHVPQSTGLVVEVAAPFGTDRLRDGDLNVTDAPPPPQRLEQRITEAQRDEVLNRLFSEIVVDAIDLLLFEDRADQRIDLVGAGAIFAERLFQHHARLRRDEPGLAEIRAHGGEQARRHRQEDDAHDHRRAPSARSRATRSRLSTVASTRT